MLRPALGVLLISTLATARLDSIYISDFIHQYFYHYKWLNDLL